MSSLEMTIVEKFNFSDGRTVFAVSINNEQKRIPNCSYDLLIDDKKVDEILIEGEMIVENQGESPFKAIATLDSQKLIHIPFESGKWKLKLNQDCENK